MSPSSAWPRDASGRTKIDATGSRPLGGTASGLAWVTVSCSPFGCLYAFGIRSAIWRTRASLLPVGSQLDQAAASGGAGRLARTTNVPTPAPTIAARATIDDPEAEPVRGLAGPVAARRRELKRELRLGGVGAGSHPRPRFLLVEIDLGLLQADAVEDPDQVVAEHLAAHHELVRDLLDRVLVAQDQVVGRDIRLAEDLRRELCACRGRRGRRRSGSRRTARRRSCGS